MKIIRLFTSTSDGNIVIEIPKEFNNRKLEIIILPANDENENDDNIEN